MVGKKEFFCREALSIISNVFHTKPTGSTQRAIKAFLSQLGYARDGCPTPLSPGADISDSSPPVASQSARRGRNERWRAPGCLSQADLSRSGSLSQPLERKLSVVILTKSWLRALNASKRTRLREDLQGAGAKLHHGQNVLQDIACHGVWLRREPKMKVAGREPTSRARSAHIETRLWCWGPA